MCYQDAFISATLFYNKSDEKYAKFAFRCGNIIATCKNKCDFDVWEFPHGDDGYACSIGVRIGSGGVGILGVVHGKDEDIALNTLIPGAPHVEEVLFVVKTESIHNGLTTGQERSKISLEGGVYKVRMGLGVDGCGDGRNRWDKGNHPDFSFVSLAPPLKDRRGKKLKHDAIQVPTKDIGTLIYRNNEFLTELANKTKIGIVPSDKAYVDQKNREIGLCNGTKEDIEKAKEEIKKQLVC
ncbi:acf8edc8-f908-406d-876b-89a463232385 [Sclerotinia trifoliorum]|uniref:Acf8edc8-f908-406d-876b-89a463232385 n=1 Tax=Sclerotinia trifoliorum TaxID=28548 RepID=A0A8H2W5E6_9HELO|nr:acf8edc8-f908-406d-876b-89a463232385 [Sclerotinia trifoliorum]